MQIAIRPSSITFGAYVGLFLVMNAILTWGQDQPKISTTDKGALRMDGNSFHFQCPDCPPPPTCGEKIFCEGNAVKADGSKCVPNVKFIGIGEDTLVNVADNTVVTQSVLEKKVKELEEKLESAENDSDSKIEELEKKLAEARQVIENLASAPIITCNNGLKDDSEGDKDCGAECPKRCENGQFCRNEEDCQENSKCENGKCKTKFNRKCSDTMPTGSGTKTVFPHGEDGEAMEVYCKDGVTYASNKRPFKFTSCPSSRDVHIGPLASHCNTQYQKNSPEFVMARQFITDVTEGCQKFVAPYDGDYIWTLYGAEGGHENQETRSNPGKGGRTQAMQKGVKKGTAFFICVGQKGEDSCCGTTTGSCSACRGNCDGQYTGSTSTFTACGGFNGGGPTWSTHNPGGASGGGGTDIRWMGNGKDTTTLPGLSSRILVAGGGGGDSAENNQASTSNNYHRRDGGHGGGLIGGRGNGEPQHNHWYGWGGGQTQGGSSPNLANGATSGTLWRGGSGGKNDAGGGGGGYYGGGGGGENGGGGGGSSYYSDDMFEPDGVSKCPSIAKAIQNLDEEEAARSPRCSTSIQTNNGVAGCPTGKPSDYRSSLENECTTQGVNSGDGYVELTIL